MGEELERCSRGSCAEARVGLSLCGGHVEAGWGLGPLGGGGSPARQPRGRWLPGRPAWPPPTAQTEWWLEGPETADLGVTVHWDLRAGERAEGPT